MGLVLSFQYGARVGGACWTPMCRLGSSHLYPWSHHPSPPFPFSHWGDFYFHLLIGYSSIFFNELPVHGIFLICHWSILQNYWNFCVIFIFFVYLNAYITSRLFVHLEHFFIFIPFVIGKKSLPKWFTYPQMDYIKYWYLFSRISQQNEGQSRCCHHLSMVIICRCSVWCL